MRYMGADEIREKFLSFWETKDHLRHESFSLIPENDKSILLIAAGMAPLKHYFSNPATAPNRRMTTAQKCIRTNDIDNVGHTDRHATFFEMLGNFSFGDYFKKEAIVWGWEFITSPQWLGIPEDKLWASIYEEDEEAFDIWRKEIGIPEERIVRLGKEDNFWEIGTGPCGPCSEVYFDRGSEYGCGSEDCKPGCECDRYMEFWNYVFTQFDKQEDGSYIPLENPNIDTGMGLERMACIMQGVDSIYNIDTMKFILDEVCRISGVVYHEGEAPADISIRIITDHVRTVVFMIGDGILPSNEGRGYILRRLLRRAVRHGRLLGIKEAFLKSLSDKVFAVYGKAYPQLSERADYIKRIIDIEEERFARTLASGSEILDTYVRDANESGCNCLSGEQVFKLYDTYGFPPELTCEIAREMGCGIDEEAFLERMKEAKELARAARKTDEGEGWLDGEGKGYGLDTTEFVGYDSLAMDARVLEIRPGVNDGEATVVLDRSPFYAEGGGQVGDVGVLQSDSARGVVTATTNSGGVYMHKIAAIEGEFKTGDSVTACVDVERRHATARNHSATHLLHRALKIVLGDHVNQAGSFVGPDMLRFDFTHFEAMTEEQIAKVQDIVNAEILKFIDIDTQVLPIEEAKELGATMLFGEKYSDSVRVVDIPGFSMELCGGTHVENTGQIGAFYIVSEAAVAAGTRRIEAVTGSAVVEMLSEARSSLNAVAKSLKTSINSLEKKAEDTAAELKSLNKQLDEFRADQAAEGALKLLENAKNFGDVKLVAQKFEAAGIDKLRMLADDVRANSKGVVTLFADINGEKGTLMVSVSDDLTQMGYHAGNIIKKLAKIVGGGGGGKADMAQAGARDISKLPEAFEEAEKIMREHMEE
ncbi:MAG: alanine--tRNA ligase [Clostridiales bacterium]|nr:alanine--tRNA ligase [Clostridiales bacterium]